MHAHPQFLEKFINILATERSRCDRKLWLLCADRKWKTRDDRNSIANFEFYRKLITGSQFFAIFVGPVDATEFQVLC